MTTQLLCFYRIYLPDLWDGVKLEFGELDIDAYLCFTSFGFNLVSLIACVAYGLGSIRFSVVTNANDGLTSGRLEVVLLLF